MDFTKDNFVESYEIFEVNLKRQRKNLLETVELAVEHTKLICKEIHAMCARSLKRLKTSDQSIWRCIHISMTHDRIDDHAVGEVKHEELIAWIQSQHLDFTKENFVESYEIFEVNFKRQRKNLLETVELAVEHTKLICKEIHAMCTRSLKRLKTSDQSIWRCIHISMTHDKKDDLDKTMSHLHAGYRSAVQQIITNPVFNDDLFKKSFSSDKKVEDRKVEDKRVEDERFKPKQKWDKDKKGGDKSTSPRGDRSPSSNQIRKQVWIAIIVYQCLIVIYFISF